LYSLAITSKLWLWLKMSNATFNNNSVISWRSVLLVDEPKEKPPTCRKSLTTA
jgi:hypothetical protein